MFLTRKAQNKIRLLTGVYCLLGTLILTASVIFAVLRIEHTLLIVLGIACLLLSFPVYASGTYAEGKGKLINCGNKLVFHALRPAEFLRLYEEKRNDPDNVLSRPDFDVLQIVASAYDALGEEERALEIHEEMIQVAPAKKKSAAKLLKASVLFSLRRREEAEALYSEANGEKLDFLSKSISDIIMKSDRAMTIGDYETAERFFKEALAEKSFTKPTPLALLYAHITLADIYCKTGSPDEAKPHIDYCLENSGETAVGLTAEKLLHEL